MTPSDIARVVFTALLLGFSILAFFDGNTEAAKLIALWAIAVAVMIP